MIFLFIAIGTDAGQSAAPRSVCYFSDTISSLAVFSPFELASSTISPASSVEDTIAVIMPEKTFICGFWNDSSEAGLPFAPAR